MTAPPVATATTDLAAVISAQVNRQFGSIRHFINAVVDACYQLGVPAGYRQVSRIYLRWQREDAHRVDVAHGLADGKWGQDRTRGNDPTGEEAVMNVMSQMLRREK